jgi:hypothetical protein
VNAADPELDGYASIRRLAEELPCRHPASVALCGGNQNLLVVTPLLSDGSKRAFNRKQRATSSEFCNQNYLVFVRGAVRQLGSGDSVLSKKTASRGRERYDRHGKEKWNNNWVKTKTGWKTFCLPPCRRNRSAIALILID